MAVHGWRPVRRQGVIGIKHELADMAVGMQVAPTEYDPLGQSIGTLRVMGKRKEAPVQDCEWDEVTDEILDKIHEWLEAT